MIQVYDWYDEERNKRFHSLSFSLSSFRYLEERLGKNRNAFESIEEDLHFYIHFFFVCFK